MPKLQHRNLSQVHVHDFPFPCDEKRLELKHNLFAIDFEILHRHKIRINKRIHCRQLLDSRLLLHLAKLLKIRQLEKICNSQSMQKKSHTKRQVSLHIGKAMVPLLMLCTLCQVILHHSKIWGLLLQLAS